MEKEEALSEFLKGLRIVLNNASAYPKNHPYFIKSAEHFKEKVELLLNFINPVKINVAAQSLYVEGNCLAGLALYEELANAFHLRKIKSIEIRPGFSNQELIDFLGAVSSPIRLILRSGGLHNILKQSASAHILVEELDYSELLQDSGEETKNIWVYFFGEALKKEDQERILEIADNFAKIISKFRARDVLEDEELRENLFNLLFYLKEKDKERFYKCLRELFRLLLKEKGIPQEEKLQKLRMFFKDFRKSDFIDVLWDEIIREESSSELSFDTFYKMIDEETHQAIALSLEEKINNIEGIRANPKVKKKIKQLFSSPDSSFIPELYRHALSSLFDGAPLEEGFLFDSDAIHVNFHFILLNLIALEPDREELVLISNSLLKELGKITVNDNLYYIKLLIGVLEKRKKDSPNDADVFVELESCIGEYVESLAFEGKSAGAIEDCIGCLKRSFFGFNYYSEKIFKEGSVNPQVLKLMLKFFPEKLAAISQLLVNKRSDMEFLGKFIKGLEDTDSPLAFELMKTVFSCANNIMKIEVLKSMRKLKDKNYDFLLSILDKSDMPVKKEAVSILCEETNMRKVLLDKFFGFKNPWGRRSSLLLENMSVIEGLQILEARDYLLSLSKQPFFWNTNVRKKAREILKKWKAN
ncbi:MAG: hypothetical protein AB1481_01360 [Candidatus Omnitrophota bacterium]